MNDADIAPPAAILVLALIEPLDSMNDATTEPATETFVLAVNESE